VRKALITGITGQDGSYLAESLLADGYYVIGIIRRASNFNTQRIDHIFGHDMLQLVHGDMLDSCCLARILEDFQPDEVYNLACQSHVMTSFDQPVYTAETIAIGCLSLLESLKSYRDRSGKEPRFYQASSSEMFGDAAPPQCEATPFKPRSPYAAAKVQAYWNTVMYREAYGLHASNGILFNHESPRRGETFVTRKITRAATRIKVGLDHHVTLGNMIASRDWGYAPDYVRGMRLMVGRDEPGDYVLATGRSTSVWGFAKLAFDCVDLDANAHIRNDECYRRPLEVDALCGDPSKAKKELGWEPSTKVEDLAKIMVEADLELAYAELAAYSLKQNRQAS